MKRIAETTRSPYQNNIKSLKFLNTTTRQKHKFHFIFLALPLKSQAGVYISIMLKLLKYPVKSPIRKCLVNISAT